MKRLLLSLCLVGAVFSGHTDLVLQSAQHPPSSIKQRVEQVAQSPAMTGENTQSIAPPRGDMQRGPLPTTGEGSEPSVPSGPEAEEHEANWVVVIRWATVHSGPSVSAPTVRFYSVGTELQLVDHQSGWLEVLDPVTSQRGWIYENYYLQAIRGPGQMVATLQKPTAPKQNVVNARKPIPHIRRAARPGKKSQPVIASAHRYRYETVASILDRALRP
jgi:hypothetical protein